MKITKLTAQQRNQDRVNVFIDGAYELSLTVNQILEQKVKIGQEVTSQDVQLLRKLSEDGKLRARVLEWLMLRPRSAKELGDYLRQKKAEPELIASIIADFQMRRYQDDAAFAAWWVEQRAGKAKSNLAIRAELQQKGVDRQIIDAALESAPSQMARLKQLVEQKSKLSKYQTDPLKFKKFLLSKGFSYSDIEDALAEGNDGDNF